MGRRSKQTFLHRKHTDGQKYTERCSTLLIIEMRIKTIRGTLPKGPAAKNPPSNTEDIGSILVKELRFHTPWEIRLSTTRQAHHYNKTPLGSGVSGELLNSLNKQ